MTSDASPAGTEDNENGTDDEADEAAPEPGTTVDPVLAATLAAHGATATGDKPGVYVTESGQTAVTEELLHGRSFTHQVSPDELVNGHLRVTPDLAPLASFARQWPVTGGAVRFEPDPSRPGSILAIGPQGWLDTLRGDTILQVTVEPDGLRFATIDPAPLDQSLVGALAALDPAGVDGDQFWMASILADDDLFRSPISPIGAHLEAADRALVDGVIRSRPEANSAPAPSSLELLATLTARAAAGLTVVDDDVARSFGSTTVVADYLEQALGSPEADIDAVATVVDAAERGGADEVGVLFARSRLAEHRGEAVVAERLLRKTLDLAPKFSAASIDAAWYASDRGDAGRAYTLLNAGGVERDDPELLLLNSYAKPGPLAAGRNDRCPCGSGKRYKKCHLATNGYGIEHRIDWMYRKVRTFAERPRQRAALWQAATRFAGLDNPLDDADRLLAAASDPLVVDLVIFDGGLLATFLEDRGQLLPADERDLFARWVEVRHRVCTAGDGILAIDDEEAAFAGAADAAHWLAVVVPADDGSAVVGTPVPLPESSVDAIAEASRTSTEALLSVAGEHLGFSAAFET